LGIVAAQLEASSARDSGGDGGRSALCGETTRIGRIEQRDAEDDGDPVAGDLRGEICAEERAEGGRHFQEHADADVRKAFADVGGRRAGGGGDDRDQRSPDGVANVDLEQQHQHGDDDHAAAEAGERAQDSPASTEVANTNPENDAALIVVLPQRFGFETAPPDTRIFANPLFQADR
jgi:hypothetical protein